MRSPSASFDWLNIQQATATTTGYLRASRRWLAGVPVLRAALTRALA